MKKKHILYLKFISRYVCLEAKNSFFDPKKQFFGYVKNRGKYFTTYAKFTIIFTKMALLMVLSTLICFYWYLMLNKNIIHHSKKSKITYQFPKIDEKNLIDVEKAHQKSKKQDN